MSSIMSEGSYAISQPHEIDAVHQAPRPADRFFLHLQAPVRNQLTIFYVDKRLEGTISSLLNFPGFFNIVVTKLQAVSSRYS